MENNLKVSCIQMDCQVGDIHYNNEKAVKLIHQASGAGAKLVILPELFNVGYDLNFIKRMKYDIEETLSILQKTAKELNLYITAGMLENIDDQKYNCVYVIDNNGEIVCKYRKINLFPLTIEQEVFGAGEEIKTFSIGNFKFGIMLCYDLRFPELSRKYVDEGCNCLILPAAFPFPRLEHWKILLQARAIENQMYVLAANRIGKDNDIWFLGNSSIIDPWGTIKAVANEAEETFVLEEIALSHVKETRAKIPCLENRDRLRTLFT